VDNRRERRKRETRAAFLKAALESFHEKGISATRIEDITERADVAKGAFYNYFESKTELVYALLMEGIELLRSIFSTTIDASWSTERRIVATVKAHEMFFTEHPEYALLFHQARGLLETKSFDVSLLRKGFKHYIDILGETVFPVEHEAALTKEQIAEFATVIAGSISGYRSYRLAYGALPNYQVVTEVLINGAQQTIKTGIPKGF